MVFTPSISSSSILSAHIRQDVSLVFMVPESISHPLKRIKKYIYATVALFGFCIFLPSSGYALEVGETKEFIVTAYYSPLPDQKSYARGSYEADIKLNGKGLRGASNTPVFTGMIAAPKSYSFGTNIFFPGLGLGRVEDTGGAIVEAWVRGQPHDRIDIWMGHGDAGLRRARAWGIRQVTGTFIAPDQAGNFPVIDIEGIDKGRIDLSSFPTTKAQSQGGISSEVIEAFAELGYLVNGSDVTNMIFQFQLDQGIVSSSKDPGAGSFGPKTKLAFVNEYEKFNKLKQIDLEIIEKARKDLLNEHENWSILISRAETRVDTFGNPARGEKGDHVRNLQETLRAIGYFKGKNTGTMTPATILALKNLQKRNGLTPTGTIDPNTRVALVETLIQKGLL